MTEEPPTVKKPGRGRAGKNEEIEPRLPTRTPAKGRPRKTHVRPQRQSKIMIKTCLTMMKKKEQPSQHFLTQNQRRRRNRLNKEPVAEPELYNIPESGAAGPSNASNQDVVLTTIEVDEVQQHQQQRLVKVKVAKVQQADSAASQPMNQPVNQSANQSTNPSANQPMNQPMNQPANQHFEAFAILGRLGLTIFFVGSPLRWLLTLGVYSVRRN